MKYKAISLFTGAGGMDIGFQSAGVDIIWANEMDKDAVITYEMNHPGTVIQKGDIQEYYQDLQRYKDVDILFGGPPCQGFSIAGKMDPSDIRNNLIWTFIESVNIVKPKVFVMENVKALLTHSKWKDVREKFLTIAEEMGYSCHPYLLNANEFGVPQKRERVFFIGFLNRNVDSERIKARLDELKKIPQTVKETISWLGPAGTERNPLTCTAKISLAQKPILRKSPYAGMLFNGAGRPINLTDSSNTLPASMGGNRTPIIDELLLHYNASDNWIEDYHKSLLKNQDGVQPQVVPARLRRLTIKESALIQTFPKDYIFHGSKTSIYKQIGNAVPIKLANAVAKAVLSELEDKPVKIESHQLSIDSILLQ